MGKALVIKNTNFSENKLTTVNILDAKPCTGISLDKSSYAFTSIGSTLSITATLTPLDTTDALLWSTSDSNVATVANGVVTCVGVGSATITATCGNQTATCSIIATHELTFTYQLAETARKGSGQRDYGEADRAETNQYGALFNTTKATTKKIRKASTSTVPASNIYPILVPKNTTELNASVPSNIKITVWFLNSEMPAEYTGSSNYAKVISGDDSPYDSSVSYGDRTITMAEGADSVIFSLRKQEGELTASDVESVSIVAS